MCSECGKTEAAAATPNTANMERPGWDQYFMDIAEMVAKQDNLKK